MKKTFIVLIPLENNRNARKQCEDIENTNFDIGGAVQATAYDVLLQVNILLGLNEGSDIEVETLTDFMDRVNNEEFNQDNYFISYVNA